ncbi:MAG: phenylacetic acid degradation protein PaaB [Chloroflexota bacterium]|nr:phenylacetic acid degradation protein PaaB [Chloroflexota bacterium]
MPMEPWEVFRQEKDGEPMTHVGNLLAPDPELALHYAREMAGRRQESLRLWVVPRSAIHVLDDLNLLKPPLDRSFKKPGGYAMRDKLRTARRRATTPAEDPNQEGAAPAEEQKHEGGPASRGRRS